MSRNQFAILNETDMSQINTQGHHFKQSTKTVPSLKTPVIKQSLQSFQNSIPTMLKHPGQKTESSSSQNIKPQYKAICKNYIAGHCRFKENCHFLHTNEQPQPNNFSQSKRICTNYVSGEPNSCRFGLNCHYLHKDYVVENNLQKENDKPEKKMLKSDFPSLSIPKKIKSNKTKNNILKTSNEVPQTSSWEKDKTFEPFDEETKQYDDENFDVMLEEDIDEAPEEILYSKDTTGLFEEVRFTKDELDNLTDDQYDRLMDDSDCYNNLEWYPSKNANGEWYSRGYTNEEVEEFYDDIIEEEKEYKSYMYKKNNLPKRYY
jgi:hypothetical protein